MKNRIESKPIPKGEQLTGFGNILIPDISGFTQFVTSVDLIEGQRIAQRLISSLLKENILSLKLSEIEGDATLLYKFGAKLKSNEILKQFEIMLENFHKEQAAINKEYKLNLQLSLKLIAHYGEFGQYELAGFKKLFGTPVIEAHRLLKNAVKSSRYVLITDDLLEGLPTESVINNPEFLRGNKMCEAFGDIRRIYFTVFNYETACSPREILENIDI